MASCEAVRSQFSSISSRVLLRIKHQTSDAQAWATSGSSTLTAVTGDLPRMLLRAASAGADFRGLLSKQ